MKIYWDNVTDVDHAILLPNGNMVGNSYIVRASAEGTNDNEEAVIIDFSAGKKKLKAYCDEHIDHRLWVNTRYHKVIDNGDTVIVKATHRNKVTFEAELPKDAIFVQSFTDTNANTYRYIEDCVRRANDLTAMGVSTPTTKISLMKAPIAFNEDRIYFRYTHGLPTSTSYGCQNICHGHLSYIELIPRPCAPYRLNRNILLKQLFKSLGVKYTGKACGFSIKPYSPTLTNFHFVCPEHCETFDDTNGISYSIKTNSRGVMKHKIQPTGVLQDSYGYAIVQTPKLSTIENLSEFFREKIKEVCPQLLQQYDIRISEGLSKGVFL